MNDIYIDLIVRKPLESDLERLSFLLRELDVLHHQVNHVRFNIRSRNQCKIELVKILENGCIYCAKTRSEIVGFASVIQKEDYLLIEHLFVEKKFRRKKIASLLVKSVCEHNLGKEIRVSVYAFNREAISFYENFFVLSSLIYRKP